MITKYGMSEKLGNLVFGNEHEVFLGKDYGHVQNYSDRLAGIIDDEVKSIIDEAYEQVIQILNKYLDMLNAMAATLLEKEKMEGDEFEAIYLQYSQNGPDAAPDAAKTGVGRPVPSEDSPEPEEPERLTRPVLTNRSLPAKDGPVAETPEQA